MLASISQDFPILKTGLVYLDSAATTQKPKCVIDAISHFYENEYGTVHRAIYNLAANATEKYDEVRAKVASFINAEEPSSIIFTRGTTDSINLVAQSSGTFLKQGDEIIVSEMEHHSNFVPWQMLCDKVGAKLKIIPINERAELDIEAYKNLLGPKTKLIAVASIANATGTINPIKTIIELAHSYGAKVLIDAAQSAAHETLDVRALDADFLAFSGHKMFGPTGIGVLYGKKELLEKMPPIQGGGDMIEKVSIEKTTFGPPPLKFEAGTPMIAEVIGLGAAVDYIQGLGLESIRQYEHDLLVYATKKLSQIEGLKIIGTAKEKAAIISFTVEGAHHLDIGTLLNLENIAIRTGHHCAQPLMDRFGITGSCRVSFCPFNTFDEIDFFANVLGNVVLNLK